MKQLNSIRSFTLCLLSVAICLLTLLPQVQSQTQALSLVGDLSPGSASPTNLYELNGELLFLVNNPNRLMSWDGTNVEEVYQIDEYIQPSSARFKIYNNKLYYAYGNNIYVSDGTAAGSYKLASLVDLGGSQYASIFNFAIYNGELYFEGGGLLYRYNENMSVPQLLPNSVERITHMVDAQGQLYFSASTGSFNILQNYQFGDGTVNGSTVVGSDPHIFVDYCSFAPIEKLDNHAVFIQRECDGGDDHNIYFDGDLVYNQAFSFQPEVVNDVLYFGNSQANATTITARVFSYQNGQLNTVYEDTYPNVNQTGQFIREIGKAGNTVYFSANNQLWKVQNGTSVLVKSFDPNYYPINFVEGNGKLYFKIVNYSDFTQPVSIYESNGTSAGTFPIYTFTSNSGTLKRVWNNELYMNYNGGSLGTELWKLDLSPNASAPTVTLTPSTSNVTGPFTVTATFSEPVSGFTINDIEAPAAILSNFSGSGSSYTFTVDPQVVGGASVVIPNYAAFDNQGNGNISNFLYFNSQIDPSTLCNVEVTTSGSSITISNIYAANPIIQLYDPNFNLVFSCNNGCFYNETIEDLAPGVYYYNVQLFTANWGSICSFEDTITVGGGCTDNDNDGVCAPEDCNDNDPNFPQSAGTSCNDGNPNTTNDVIQSDGCTCSGTLIGGNECDNVNISAGNGSITVSGLNTTPVALVQIFDSSWNLLFSCAGDCNATETQAVPDGDYYVNAYLYTAGWQLICDTNQNLTVGGGGCTDNDNDGVCAEDDCNDNNANFPQPAGTSCNDGNSNTTNDVIQSDGCTCAGTPIGGGCNVTASSANGVLTISGLSGQDNAKVFSPSYATVWDCNPWGGGVCSSTETVTGLTVGATYFVSVQSNVCDEWIPVTISGGGGGSQPDLTVSDLSGFASSANAGDVMNYTIDINNIGNASTGSYEVGMYISTDQSYSSNDILAGEIPTGNTGPGTIQNVPAAITVPANLATGQYYLIVVIDHLNSIVESNENNNTLVSSAFQVSGGGGGGCSASYTYNSSSVTVTGLGSVASVLLMNSSWSPVYSCDFDCGSSVTIPVSNPVGYIIKIKLYDSNYQFVCEIFETIGGNNNRVEQEVVPTLSNIFPNPAYDQLNLMIDSEEATDLSFALYDGKGQYVKQLNYTVQEGLSKLTIDISELPTGLYSLLPSQPINHKRSLRFIKQRL